MKCAECVTLGQRSTVTVGATTTTAMAVSAYYDEDGHYHYNDPNITTTEYHCSRGHRWHEQTGAGQFSATWPKTDVP